MSETQAHLHRHLESEWPFGDPIKSSGFTSGQVFSEGAPILLAFHDHDGEWQFLHGPVVEGDECNLICFGCALDRDQSLRSLATLPSGWCASRDTPTSPWQCASYEDSDAE